MEALNRTELTQDLFLMREVESILGSVQLEQVPEWDTWAGSVFEDSLLDEDKEGYRGLGFI